MLISLLSASLLIAPFLPPPQGVPEYSLVVRVQPDSSRMAVQGTIRFVPPDAATDGIALVVHGMFRNVRFELLEPRQRDTLAVTHDTSGGGSVWVLRPARPLRPGQPVTVRFSYVGGEQTAIVFHLGPDGSFAGSNTAWYPQIAGATGSRAKGTGTFVFSVPPGYTVVAVGKRTSTDAEGAKGTFRYVVRAPLSFSFAAGRYIVARGAGAVPMTLYLLRDRPTRQDYLDGCARALAVLIREFGTFPHSDFAIVETPTEPSQQAGFSGASVDGFILTNTAGLDDPFNLAYYAHEISHQWWGNVITVDGQRGTYMLSEAMAQYGSLRTVEELEGAAMAERYRRTGYPGYNSEQNALGYLKVAAAGLDTIPMSDLPRGGISHDLANMKGFLVWDMLSRTIGRDRFRLALADFVRASAFRPVTWDHFVSSMQQSTNRELGWFFEQWTARTGAPEWRVEWRWSGDSVRATLTQVGEPYRASVDVEVTGDSGRSLTRSVVLEGPVTTVTWQVPFQVRAVVPDSHFTVLHWAPELARQARRFPSYTRAIAMEQSGQFKEAYAAFGTALESVPEPDTAGTRFMVHHALGRMFVRDQRWTEAKSHLQAAIASPGSRPDVLPWTYYRLALAAKNLGDTTLMCEAARRSIEAGSTNAAAAVAPSRAFLADCKAP